MYRDLIQKCKAINGKVYKHAPPNLTQQSMDIHGAIYAALESMRPTGMHEMSVGYELRISALRSSIEVLELRLANAEHKLHEVANVLRR